MDPRGGCCRSACGSACHWRSGSGGGRVQLLGKAGAGHRVEHAQHLASLKTTPNMLADAGACLGTLLARRVHCHTCPSLPITARHCPGVTVVTNPLHLLSDWRTLTARVGTARAGRAFALRTLLEAGVPQAFGSDWPVVEMDCLGAMHTAVHWSHPDHAAMGTWGPGEAIAAQAALEAHTVWAAEAGRAGDVYGSLRCVGAPWVLIDGCTVHAGCGWWRILWCCAARRCRQRVGGPPRC